MELFHRFLASGSKSQEVHTEGYTKKNTAPHPLCSIEHEGDFVDVGGAAVFTFDQAWYGMPIHEAYKKYQEESH